jgi:hypothetical protein
MIARLMPACSEQAMGIDVSDAKVVTFNPNHEKRVDTNVARKPPRQDLDGLKVASVLARKMVTTDNHDGNPLGSGPIDVSVAI